MRLFLVFALFFLIYATRGQNYLGTPIHTCVQCLCHAVTGCYRRQNCATYNITKSYWMEASSPVVDENDNPQADLSYRKCIRDENCIVETIYKYTEIYKRDCNCDGKFDCKDRLAIHLFGAGCFNPMFGTNRARRFNECRESKKDMNVDSPMDAEEDLCNTV